MKKTTQQARTRMARRHVKERKAATRNNQAALYMSWQNRLKQPKHRTPERRRILNGGLQSAAAMMGLVAVGSIMRNIHKDG